MIYIYYKKDMIFSNITRDFTLIDIKFSNLHWLKLYEQAYKIYLLKSIKKQILLINEILHKIYLG